jgi:hypothetical protein
MATSDHGQLREALLGVLPEDGSPIPNAAAKSLVSRRLSRLVEDAEYFEARDELLQQRLVGRVRGQGGSVYLLGDQAAGADQEELETSAEPSERELMAPFGVALAGSFCASLDLPRSSPLPIIEDISTKGPRRGVWARPDYTLVSLTSYSVLPGAHVDVHVFELKNEAGGGLKAVHEALAQARFANFAHLAWFMPNGSTREPELQNIASHCAQHGVGLLRLRVMPKPHLEVLVSAKRTGTTSLEVDGFLESRLSDVSKRKLAKAIRAGSDQ